MESLSGKKIAILGASGGIGSSIVERSLSEGAQVFALGRSLDRLSSLPPSTHGRMEVDLLNAESWGKSIESLPRLEGAVVCSGRLDLLPFGVLSPARFAESMSVNVIGPAMFLRSLLRAGKLSPGGSIVYIGSIAGIRAAPGHLAYATAKAALHGLVRSLALELSAQRIRVNLVSPGFVTVGMGATVRRSITDEQMEVYSRRYLLGLGKPEDVAGPVVFLLSDNSSWITGQDLIVDGGATLQ